MKAVALLASLDKDELTYEASPLIAWEIGAADSIDSVAQFMYQGGPVPPQGAIKRPGRILLSEDDPRPEKKYWDFVKGEMLAFLCSSDEKYKELWERIEGLEKKTTPAVVGLIAGYLGGKVGVQATLFTGFVAVVLYGAIKIGKEAFCQYHNASST